MQFLTGLLTVIAVCNLILAQTNQTTGKAPLEHNQHMSDFQAFEFRRLAQLFQQRRLCTAGGAPVGVEYDRHRLIGSDHRIVLRLIEWNLGSEQGSCKYSQYDRGNYGN